MFVVLASIVIGHFVAAQRAELNKPSGRTIWLMTGILAWMLLLSFLASIGVFAKFELIPPRLPMILFLGMLTLLFIITRSATKRMAQAIPLHWPLVLQGFRLPLEFILWALFINNALPEQMTFSGYNYDVLSGIFGLVIGAVWYKGWLKSKAALWVYNVVGLALLLTIVTIAVLSFPTGFRYFMNDPPNTIVAHVPYVWLPGVYVMTALFLHLFSFVQLSTSR